MKIFINGRFLTQKITGVQRFGIEVTRELDKICKPGEIILLTPPGIVNKLDLMNIKIKEIGKKSNNFWVQYTLPRYVRKHKGVLLTMSGMLPILAPDYFVAHDATFMRFPETFSRRFVKSYKLSFNLGLKRCKKIFTISNFSKHELMEIFNLKSGKFQLVTNSSDHLRNQQYKYIPVEKWNLQENEYYLSVSSKAKHKNQNYLYELAKKYPQKTFAIAGGIPKTFAEMDHKQISNLKYTGYVSNDELFSLYKKARGFIFPSLYEGFGIPPLEAITMGVKHVAVSNIPVFKEIYKRGVYFFDPHNVDSFNIEELDKTSVTKEDFEYYLNKHSWKKTAEIIYRTMKNS